MPLRTVASIRFAIVTWGWLAAVGQAHCAESDANRETSLPPLTRQLVEEVVARQLSAVAGYAPGDLISRREAEPILNELVDRGYRAREAEGLAGKFLPESHPLVKTLRTPEGTTFMRAVAKLPEAYDRLERLTWTDIGRRLLSDMINSPDGVRGFKHLLTKEGSEVVEGLLSGDASGANFQLPTNKVHTANELIDRICTAFGVGSAAE